MSCKIILENYDGTYYPGSDIRGRLECYFDDQTTLRGIKIRLKCKEFNEWTGTESYTDPSDNNRTKTRHITLRGEKDVLYIEQMLFGSDHGSLTVSRGRHVYPFNYSLPMDIPSSYRGPHGSITYKLKGIVDRPMRTDYEDAMFLNVVAPIDFNRSFKSHQQAVTYSDEKTVCCWCCKGGNISMDVELPKTAFVAGEKVPFTVTITNLSNSNVEDLKVKFVKTIEYRVTSPHHETKKDHENICTINEHGVGAHGEHTYNLVLDIPKHTEVPNFTRCSLFEVSNELKFSCEMPSCTLDLDIEIHDIKLGHIPYTGLPEEGHQGQGDTNKMGFVSPSPYPANTFAPADNNFAPPPSNTFPGAPYPPPNYPQNSGYAYPPPGPQLSPGYPPSMPQGFSDKPVYPPGPPSAPTPSFPSAPAGSNPKAMEAAASGWASAPNAPSELPPPSYNQVQQNSAPYPPQQNSAPYPPQQNSAPYPPQQNSAPYPPQQNSVPYPPQ